eukprot:Clim_evm2s223 gene=Clim_evmTU2s223
MTGLRMLAVTLLLAWTVLLGTVQAMYADEVGKIDYGIELFGADAKVLHAEADFVILGSSKAVGKVSLQDGTTQWRLVAEIEDSTVHPLTKKVVVLSGDRDSSSRALQFVDFGNGAVTKSLNLRSHAGTRGALVQQDKYLYAVTTEEVYFFELDPNKPESLNPRDVKETNLSDIRGILTMMIDPSTLNLSVLTVSGDKGEVINKVFERPSFQVVSTAACGCGVGNGDVATPDDDDDDLDDVPLAERADVTAFLDTAAGGSHICIAQTLGGCARVPVSSLGFKDGAAALPTFATRLNFLSPTTLTVASPNTGSVQLNVPTMGKGATNVSLSTVQAHKPSAGYVPDPSNPSKDSLTPMQIDAESGEILFGGKATGTYAVGERSDVAPESSWGSAVAFGMPTSGENVLLQLVSGDYIFYNARSSQFKWRRPESLGDAIRDAVFVKLPANREELSEFEEEYDVEDGNQPTESNEPVPGKRLNLNPVALTSAFVKRVSGQIHSLAHAIADGSIVTSLLTFGLDIGTSPDSTLFDGRTLVTRDDFDLRQLVVVCTKRGTLAAISTVSKGRVLWSTDTPLQCHSHPAGLAMVRPCTGKKEPLMVMAGSDGSGKEGLVEFNPLTGAVVSSRLGLDGPVKFVSRIGEEHSELVVMRDGKGNLISVPASEQNTVDALKKSKFVIYDMDEATGIIRGYLPPKSEANLLYEVDLTPNDREHIVGTVKRDVEHDPVHWLGKAGEENIQFKYLNPNLLFVLSEDIDPATGAVPASKQDRTLHVNVLDLVKGSLLDRFVLSPGSSTPVKAVAYENRLVIHYWNSLDARFEISVIELYDAGRDVAKISTSSHTRPPLRTLAQSFIFNHPVTTIGFTTTTKGISMKEVLFGMAQGSVYALDQRMLDPTRPHGEASEAQKENGIAPYAPILPLMGPNIISHTRPVYYTEGIISGPARLESTSHVFAYGLDLFYTRLTPSGAFDLLTDEFDAIFVIIGVLGVIIGTLVLRHMSQEKVLGKKWK